MRIDGFNTKELLNLKLDANFLKEGSIISGEIIEILEDGILLNIEALGLIKGQTEIPIDNLKGRKLSFLVKSNEENSIKLVPLLEEKPKDHTISLIDKECVIVNNTEDMLTKNHIISNILAEYNVVEDETTFEMIETLFKYNIPVNKENIGKSIKVFDKIDYICNKTSREKIILLNNEIDPIKSDIIDFVLVDKMEYLDKISLDFIYDEIKPMISEGKPNSEFIKTAIFLLKNNMTVSVNNLKNLFKLMDNEEMIPEKFMKILKNYPNKVDIDKNVETNKVNISFTEKDIASLREYNEGIKERLEIIKGFSKKDKIEVNKNLEKIIEELGDRIEFLNDLNKEMSLLYIPITIKGEERDGSISFLKKKKDFKGKSDRLNIFINLNMLYLGNVKIICEAFDDLVNVKFYLDEQYLYFIKSYETTLYEMVEDKGYKLNALTYITDKETSLLDIFIDNHQPYYYLDVRV